MKPLKSLFLISLFCCTPEVKNQPLEAANILLLSGELTANSVILQGRFIQTDTLVNYDISGVTASGRFEISNDSSFAQIIPSHWLNSDTSNDFTIKAYFNGLITDTRYYYRVKSLVNSSYDTTLSSTGHFRTLPDPSSRRAVSFAVSTGFNYEKYYGIDSASSTDLYPPATGVDRISGFEAFDAVKALSPHFFIANGDVVYYDNPTKMPPLWARNRTDMRAKWHRYFAMPRNRDLCMTMPVFYLKDDHDYRFNDCDTTNIKFSEPSHHLGIQIFREQLPVVDLTDYHAKTYRTVRAGKLLQLWFLEGRDYRSPNLQQDTPEKTVWGHEQKHWLKETLLDSEATFKIIISPTPMIGPDDAYKKDNHTNIGGFRSEQREIFTWLMDHDFLDKNLYFICGDRHWQYHSIHPNGLQEFSSGAFVNQNSRPGRKPGDPESTDPEGTISTPFLQLEQFGGGFLFVKVYIEGDQPTINFSFRDTKGEERYGVNMFSARR